MTSFGKKKNAFGHKKELTLESLLRVVEQQQDKIDELKEDVKNIYSQLVFINSKRSRGNNSNSLPVKNNNLLVKSSGSPVKKYK